MTEYWIILLAIAVAVAFAADKLKQPYPTLLVVAGLVIGVLPIPALEEVKAYISSDRVFQTTIILIFLAALLGDAALKLPIRELQHNKRPILLLALLGTFLTFVIIALLTHIFLGLSLQQALVFGALMSATDPVSVLSIFKSMGLNERLSIIVEGESLANDGVAVVLFKIALVTAVLSAAGAAYGFTQFVIVAGGGLFIGGLCGFIASRITARIDNYLVEVGLSVVLFYGAFAIAEIVHLSGVFAVVTAGLVFGTYGKRIGMSERTLEKIDSFWEMVAFLSNAVIFLMIGLEISRIHVLDQGGRVVLSVVIVIAARILAVYISLMFDRSIPSSWKPVIAWGGLKGSLSIALMLSVSMDFAGRELLLAMTFTNVIVSLLLQGTTIRKLVAVLGVK